MLKQMQIQAPAKINLFLKVLKRREDGYHNIISLFRKIGLYDNLSITIEPAAFFSCTISGSFIFPDEDNLIWKAAEIFSHHIQHPLSFTITCKKNIPEGSGLGGGSSDAAATLIAANELAGSPYSKYELKSLSEELGSDIPFFMDDSSTALITGRGEIIRPILNTDNNYWLVIVYPGFNISSGEAYKRLNTYNDSYTKIIDNSKHVTMLSEFLCSQMLQPPDLWEFGNDFEKVLLDEYPVYKAIKEQLVRSDALFTLLTGSGSAYYGIFENKTAAKKAATSLSFQFPASHQIMLCQY